MSEVAAKDIKSSKKSCSTCGPLGLRPAILHPNDIDFGERARREYNDGQELEFSIREKGIIQSLLVLERPGLPYLLLAGGRRYRIAKEIGLEAIPVLISTVPLDELEIKTIEMIENLHRRQLTYEEDLRLKKEIHELQVRKNGLRVSKTPSNGVPAEGWTVARTASMLGIERSTLAKDLKLAEAIELLPELSNLKNKSEAHKLLDRMTTTVVREEKAAEIDKKMGSENNAKRQLCAAYIVRDFFEGVKELPAKHFQLCEVDPPYGIDIMNIIAARQAYADMKRQATHVESEYNEVPPEAYTAFMQKVLAECYRVMTDDAWLIWWFANEPWFEPTYQAITNAGFKTSRLCAVWTKPSGALLNASYSLASAYEGFFYARKNNATIHKEGRTNVFAYPGVSATKRIHPTERPIEMIQDVLSTFAEPAANVLVPFAGSGNTLLAAANLRMQPIGFDLTKAYKDGFVLRVHGGDIGHYRSYKE